MTEQIDEAQDSAVPLHIPIKPHRDLIFHNPSTAAAFLEKEYSFWSWAFSSTEIQKQAQFGALVAALNKTFGRLRNAISSWSENPTAQDRKTQVANHFSFLYNELKLPFSTDPEAALISRLKEHRGATAAMAALATQMGKLRLEANLPEINRDILVGALALASLDTDSPGGPAIGELKALSHQLQGLYIEISETKDRALSALKELQNRGASQIAKQEADFKARWDSEFNEIWNRINEGLAKLHATDEAFTKQMQLQASVSYWSNRATSQRYFANHLLKVIIAYAVGVFVCGAIAANLTVPSLITASLVEQPARYAVALTITLLSATIVFWIGRVLVKLYLSAHHLSTVASERVVMIETFLALLKEGKLEDKDKALVLAPLFTSPSDGLVKDDGAPDASVAALISRFLERR